MIWFVQASPKGVLTGNIIFSSRLLAPDSSPHPPLYLMFERSRSPTPRFLQCVTGLSFGFSFSIYATNNNVEDSLLDVNAHKCPGSNPC